jgi:hypothetical protein
MAGQLLVAVLRQHQPDVAPVWALVRVNLGEAGAAAVIAACSHGLQALAG